MTDAPPTAYKNYYFGKHWGVPALDGAEQIETPIGKPCYWCEDAIADGDCGFMKVVGRMVDGEVQSSPEAAHRECDYRAIAGSLGHHLGMCSCYGGAFEDPSELTKRQAAIAAWRCSSMPFREVW